VIFALAWAGEPKPAMYSTAQATSAPLQKAGFEDGPRPVRPYMVVLSLSGSRPRDFPIGLYW
jgi:hypothetical protein